jgi:hypothetical protein
MIGEQRFMLRVDWEISNAGSFSGGGDYHPFLQVDYGRGEGGLDKHIKDVKKYLKNLKLMKELGVTMEIYKAFTIFYTFDEDISGEYGFDLDEDYEEERFETYDECEMKLKTRPKSPYSYFMISNRKALILKYSHSELKRIFHSPDMSNVDAIATLSNIWIDLEESERKEYLDKSQADKEFVDLQNSKLVDVWKTLSVLERREYIDMSDNDKEKYMEKYTEKLKPIKLKENFNYEIMEIPESKIPVTRVVFRKMNGYLYFLQCNRNWVQLANPGMLNIVFLLDLWEDLTDIERNEYKNMVK